ncbi:hypothetical protein CDL12_04230 [Handroanthus impetiginosus]|uniref:Transmembrane protein n=1 Tax=Handroanthus impetiginosus TaxID=429701 RepID=A0A2G9HZW4_9LAMI|nr:hypothetical protein CDL12_04230 [Handroanthus impetiginosus]
MDPVKNRGRTNFFGCFKPVADEDEPCIHPLPPPSGSESSGRTKTAHQMFYRSLKTVFLRTPLVKKLRNKRYSRRDSCRSSCNLSSSKPKKLITSIKKRPSQMGFSDQEELILGDNSDCNSSLFSSSCANSCASSISSRSGSERIEGSALPSGLRQTITKNRQHGMKRGGIKCYDYNPVAGMCVVLVCLAALVFGGKAFAIVTCVSTWLVFAPSRPSEVSGRPTNNVVVESEEDRKRVIIEGLLERNRPRIGFTSS